jgi:hypothetical protein
VNAGGIQRRLRFRPDPDADGAFEPPAGAPIPAAAPDWDRALELLRRINALSDSSGRRVPALLTEDGFEPWWYGQDRLLRFELVPLTQLLPLLENTRGADSVVIDGAPAEFNRVLAALSGREGFPRFEVPAEKKNPNSAGRRTLLLLSLFSLALFRVLRRDTLLFIIDHVSPGLRQDFRFTPLYAELERRRFRYAEYAHSTSPRQALRNFFRRRRPVFFVEGADYWARVSGVRAAVPEWEPAAAESASIETRAIRALVPSVLEGCALAAARQRMLRRALRFQRVRRALIFDDNRHNHELIAACRSLEIPVLGFQHGVFNKFHAGLMAYGFSGARPHAYDRYGVWSPLFRDRLLRDGSLHPAERIFVSGPVRPPAENVARAGRTGAQGGRIRVLVVSEPLARKREVAPYLRTLLADPQFELFLKLRPGESTRSLEEYGLPADRVRLIQTETVYEAFARVDAAIGTYSTVLYEAALAELPIVWLKTTRAYGRELAEERLAERADRPEDLPAAIRRAAALPVEELRKRRERTWGGGIADGATALVRELSRLAPEQPGSH